MPYPRLLRIVVASPGDVQAERDVLAHVVEELNHGWCQEHDVPRAAPAATPRGRRTTARLTGTGAIAQGQGAVAAGQDGVAVGGNVQDSIVVTGNQATVLVNTAGGADGE